MLKTSHSENGKLKTIETKSWAQKEIRAKTNSCRLFAKCITLILSMYTDMRQARESHKQFRKGTMSEDCLMFKVTIMLECPDKY